MKLKFQEAGLIIFERVKILESEKGVKVVNSKSVGSVRAYFIRGHGGWLLYAVWFLSNITILYVLLGSQVDWVYQLIPNIFMFGTIFIASYVAIAIIIGYVDIEIRGIFGQETDVYWRAIPSVQKLLKGAKGVEEMKESIEEMKECTEEIKTILGQLIVTVDELLRDKEREGK